MIKKSQLQFLGGEANFPKRFTLDTDCKGFQNDLFCSKQKYRSLEATVTKSQQVITLLRICVVLVYFSYISCFISLQPWEWKSAAYEIAVPDACTKYFDICVSIEKVDCFPKTLETCRAVKPPSPVRETIKRNMLGVGQQSAVYCGCCVLCIGYKFIYCQNIQIMNW